MDRDNFAQVRPTSIEFRPDPLCIVPTSADLAHIHCGTGPTQPSGANFGARSTLGEAPGPQKTKENQWFFNILVYPAVAALGPLLAGLGLLLRRPVPVLALLGSSWPVLARS